ncbi:MAG: triose-phosphate isomerase [Syntrophomonadaceae bacterium]
MRTPLIAGNWKMFKTVAESEDFAARFKPLVADVSDVDILVCPPFTSLYSLSKSLNNTRIMIGAQNIFWENQGAFTGEISPPMLVDAGCTHVIIGHSERRNIMHETDPMINNKLRSAVGAGLVPVLCVGEKLEERRQNRAREVVQNQLTIDLKDIHIAAGGLVIAYEPVWAIGTGVNASVDDAQEMIGFIRSLLGEIYNETIADSVRILYGGSVKPENIAGFMAAKDVDGALVGGASLDPQTFARIVRFKDNG